MSAKRKINKKVLNDFISDIKAELSSEFMLMLKDDCDISYLRLRMLEELRNLDHNDKKQYKLIIELGLIALLKLEDN